LPAINNKPGAALELSPGMISPYLEPGFTFSMEATSEALIVL
jgi:hypothetical protein